MMNEEMRLSSDELPLWAMLIALHFKRTSRNPTETECSSMAETARAMAECDAVLQ